MNKTMMWLAIFGVCVGRIISRNSNENGQIKLLFIIVTSLLIYTLYLIINRQFFASLTILIMLLPLLIILIGIYVDNLIVEGFGLVSIFIVYPLYAKWTSRLVEDYGKTLWNHKGMW